MSISKEFKAQLINQYGISKKNTGSIAAQIAILTAEINAITLHVNANHKDYSSKRGLYKKVQQRRRLLKYLMDKDIEQYRSLIKDLGLRN